MSSRKNDNFSFRRVNIRRTLSFLTINIGLVFGILGFYISCGNPYSADLGSAVDHKSAGTESSERSWWLDDNTQCVQTGTYDETNKKWDWSDCDYKCSSDGFYYSESDGTCVDESCLGSKTKDCSSEIGNGNGQRARTCNNGVWSEWGNCSVTSCDDGYKAEDNQCAAVKCSFNGEEYLANAITTVENCMSDSATEKSEKLWQCKKQSNDSWAMEEIESCHATKCIDSNYEIVNGKCQAITVTCTYTTTDSSGSSQTLTFSENEIKSIGCGSQIANSKEAYEKYECKKSNDIGQLTKVQECTLSSCTTGYDDSDNNGTCELSTVTCSYLPVNETQAVTISVNGSYTDDNKNCFAHNKASKTQYTVTCKSDATLSDNCAIVTCDTDFHKSSDGKSCEAHQCLDPNNLSSTFTPYAGDSYGDTLTGQNCSDSLADVTGLSSATRTWTCKTKSDNSGAEWDKSGTCQITCADKYEFDSTSNKCVKKKCTEGTLSVEVDSTANGQSCKTLPTNAISGSQSWTCSWDSSTKTANWTYSTCTPSQCGTNYKLDGNSCTALTCSNGSSTYYTYNDSTHDNDYEETGCLSGTGVESSTKKYTCKAYDGGTTSAYAAFEAGSCEVTCKSGYSGSTCSETSPKCSSSGANYDVGATLTNQDCTNEITGASSATRSWTCVQSGTSASWDKSGTCSLSSCDDSSYFKSGNNCNLRYCDSSGDLNSTKSGFSCSISNGTGTQSKTCKYDSSASTGASWQSPTSCTVATCNNGYKKDSTNNTCTALTCTNGSTYYTSSSGKTPYKYTDTTSCSTAAGVTGSQRVRTCTASNDGTASATADWVYGSCTITSCNTAGGYYLDGSTCSQCSADQILSGGSCIPRTCSGAIALNTTRNISCTPTATGASSGTATEKCVSDGTATAPGGKWQNSGTCTITGCQETDGYYFKSSDSSCVKAKSCKEIIETDSRKKNVNGMYSMYPFRDDSLASTTDKSTKFSLYCDMKTDGGGYTGIDLYNAYNFFRVFTTNYGLVASSTSSLAKTVNVDTSTTRIRVFNAETGGTFSYMFPFKVPFGFSKFFVGRASSTEGDAHTFKMSTHSGSYKDSNGNTKEYDTEINGNAFIAADGSRTWANVNYHCDSDGSGGRGDIAFGAIDTSNYSAEKPRVSFAQYYGASAQGSKISSYRSPYSWTRPSTKTTEFDYDYSGTTKYRFAIGVGECGKSSSGTPQEEGFDVWTAGKIFFK